VLLISKNEHEIWIENSEFDCQMPFLPEEVFSMRLNEFRGEHSLFELKLPTTEHVRYQTELAGAPTSGYGYDEESELKEEQTEYEKEVICEPLDRSEWLEHGGPRPDNQSVASYARCHHTMYYWQFKNNKYHNCNQGHHGAIFNI
jgi:hypothetical protein